MNNDNNIDDLLEDFDFKPITEGLGFHHSLKQKKEVETSLKTKQASLESDMLKRVNSLQKEAKSIEKPVHMGELSAFYEADTQTPVQKIESEISLQVEEESAYAQPSIMAPMHFRFVAWLLDVSILLTTMVFTIGSILIFADLPMDTFNIMMISDELSVSFIAIAIMFYMFYFTLLDATRFSTLGKKIVGLTLESNRGRVNLVQSFTRSLLTLVGIPLLGLPSILRLDNLATGTYVSNN